MGSWIRHFPLHRVSNILKLGTLSEKIRIEILKDYLTVRDITWIGAIRCALHQVEVTSDTNDTWLPTFS